MALKAFITLLLAALLGLAASQVCDICDAWTVSSIDYSTPPPIVSFTLRRRTPFYCVALDTVPCSFVGPEDFTVVCSQNVGNVGNVPSAWQNCNYLVNKDGTNGGALKEAGLKWRVAFNSKVNGLTVEVVQAYEQNERGTGMAVWNGNFNVDTECEQDNTKECVGGGDISVAPGQESLSYADFHQRYW